MTKRCDEKSSLRTLENSHVGFVDSRLFQDIFSKMNHFRAFANSVASVAKDITKEFQNSFDDTNRPTGRQYTIGGKVVREVKLLSEGGFGFVYLVTDVSTNSPYVVKKILCQDRERYELASREIEIFEKLPIHLNLVRYYGHIWERDSKSREAILLLEYCPGGHLYDLMQKHGGRVPTDIIIKVLTDLTRALITLQSMNPPIQHRDVKLENVLLNSSGNYVLVDFGSWSSDSLDLSKLGRDDLMKFGEIVERYTTLMYRPPEMADLYKGFKVSGQVDVWMAGCVLFSLINNQHPFQNASNLAIVNCRYSFVQEECKRHHPKLVELCAWMLAQNPSDRPTPSQLASLLDNWSAELNENLMLPTSVVERIQKDSRLYGIPSMTRSSVVTSSDTSGWSKDTKEKPSAGWEAKFDSGESGHKQTSSGTTPSELPDLLG
jgi:serine/threonine protein kinase